MLRTIVDQPTVCPVCGRIFYFTGDVLIAGTEALYSYYELSEPDPQDPDSEAYWHHGWEAPECPYCYTPLAISP